MYFQSIRDMLQDSINDKYFIKMLAQLHAVLLTPRDVFSNVSFKYFTLLSYY